MQAMDRCHRIGQTKPVHVYRLATSHSIEVSRAYMFALDLVGLENILSKLTVSIDLSASWHLA